MICQQLFWPLPFEDDLCGAQWTEAVAL